MKQLFIFLLLLATLQSFATNYYVNPAGSDSNTGLTPATAFATLNHAPNQTAPGDTVFVMNGTYTDAYPDIPVLMITNSGTASNPIVFKNYPGHTPLIKINANNWVGISFNGSDYIVVDGFTIVGNNDSIDLAYAQAEMNNTSNPATSSNGIGIAGQYDDSTNKPHHNIVRNCTISKCGGGGIFTYGADYTTIENNIVHDCAWYAPYGNSGISLYQNWNSDSLRIIKNYILGNTCYRNENYIPFFAAGSITDGNGIIIDDGRNTQNSSTQGIYLGKTYIANNLIYDNGGRGIHCYLSDNVIIVNNTCYQNCQSPAIDDGEYTAYDSDSTTFINNIAFPSPGVPPIDQYSTTSTTIIADHNLWAANANLANPSGTNTITGSPNFVFPASNPATADFHLQTGSVAINSGTITYAPGNDKDGNTRLPTDSIDLGCYEYQNTVGLPVAISTTISIRIYPNPASHSVSVQFPQSINRPVEFLIFDCMGKQVLQVTASPRNGLVVLDISDLENGLYSVQVRDGSNDLFQGRLVRVGD